MSDSIHSIGIDLGTTNSVGSYYDGNEARILNSMTPDGVVPSVVVYRKSRKEGKDGDILVGQAAVDYAFRDPQNAIWSIKRFMGRAFDESKTEEVRERVNYNIVKNTENDDPGVRIMLGDKQYTPEDISAMILGQIKLNAENTFNNEVTHAVITVPAYFEERQRAATRLAGEKANLVVKKIIDEPTAAAIAYGITVAKGKRQRILVFDLGGGTFDVSIIMATSDERGRPHFEVLDTGGDNWLGGDDFDQVIIQRIYAHVETEHDHDAADDRGFQWQAKLLAEKAKKQLTNSDVAEILAPAAGRASDGNFFDLDFEVTREQFEGDIRPLVDSCMNQVSKTLTKQGLTADDIDIVLMVGGSTLVPLVRSRVTSFFGKERVQQTLNPYHAVAQGAGILAATLKGVVCPRCEHVSDEASQECEKCGEGLATAISAGDVSLGEVTAMAFGINAVRGDKVDQFEVIIPKTTPYPLKQAKTRRFSTTQDNFICIHVYEGNETKASQNDEQGVIEVTADEFESSGVNVAAGAEVEISMNYNRDRELHVGIRIPKYNFFKEKKVRRDRARESTDTQDGKWREEVEQLIALAMDFKASYMMYMEPQEQLRLDKQIERAQEALMTGNALAGRTAPRFLTGAIDACGVASLIFLADRVSGKATSPDRARQINDVTARIKQAWHAQDKDVVAELTKPLRTVIAAEITAKRETEGVHGQEIFGGALRVD